MARLSAGTSSTTLPTSPAWSSALPILAPPATQPPGPGTTAAAREQPLAPASLRQVRSGVDGVDRVADHGHEAGQVEPDPRRDAVPDHPPTGQRSEVDGEAAGRLVVAAPSLGCRGRAPGAAAPRRTGRGTGRPSGGCPTRSAAPRRRGGRQRPGQPGPAASSRARLVGQHLGRTDLPAEAGEDLGRLQHPGAFPPQCDGGENQSAVGGGGGDAGPPLHRQHRGQPAPEDGHPVGRRDQPVGRPGGVCRVVDRQRRAEQRVVDRRRHCRGTARFSARA